MDDPIKMFEIICDKQDKKGNNNLSNICKEWDIFKLNNTKVETGDWFTGLYT